MHRKTVKVKNVMSLVVGIQVLMSLVRFPNYEPFWSREFRCHIFVDLMNLKRYERIRRFLHDNTTRKESEACFG